MKLRPYQLQAARAVNAAWASGVKCVMLKLPTGGGKTPTFAHLLNDEPGASVVIAHRSELVSQSSLALARYGIRHRIIGPAALARQCTQIHMGDRDVGRSFVDPNAKTAVAGVDTLIRRPADDPLFMQVRKWVVDEGHHLLADNKWGRAVAMFPNALGLAVTATPGRPDGRGLGRHADGLADTLIRGPEMRELIDAGYLTDYKIYCPPSDVDISQVHISASGEFNPAELSEAVHKSKSLTGDVVKHYLKLAPGKLGITFAVDVAAATEYAAAFRAAGVPAEVITGETPPILRAAIMRRFRAREVLQLCNVEVLGEGVDVPAVEVVSMARHTASFITYAQQFGRMIRLLLPAHLAARWDTFTDAERKAHIATSEKPFGILLDHVGNVLRHNGPPDVPREDSLDRRERKSIKKSDAIPLRTCVTWTDETGYEHEGCMQPYERVLKECPYCKCPIPPPVSRSAPEFVDGDLSELDAETLAAMRGEIERVDGDAIIPYGASPEVAGAVRRRHWDRQEAQRNLRNVIAWWAGLQHAQGRSESESYRRFWYTFGVDVASCQALGAREATELAERVNATLSVNGIDGTVNAGAYFSRHN